MENETSSDVPVPHRRCGYFVLSLFKYEPDNGKAYDLLQLAEELCRRGHRVLICCAVWNGPRPGNCEVRVLPCGGWSNCGRARKFSRALTREVRRETPDLHIAFNRIPGADVFFAEDNPLIHSLRRKRSLLFRFLPRFWLLGAMERAIFRPGSPSRIFCISEQQRQQYLREYGTPPERMFLLPPGILGPRKPSPDHASLRRKKREELGIGEEEIVLLTVGSGYRAKGVDRTILALAALPEEYRERTRFLVAGCGKTEPFRKLAASLDVGDRVLFIPRPDDIPALLPTGDLLMHPARSEAGGNILLGALVAGVPVLTTSNCGFAPYVAEAENPVLPEPFRQQELDRALLLILSVPGRLEELAREAAAYGVSADFCRRAQTAADRIEEFLHEKA